MIRSVVIIGSGNLAEALARAVAASPLGLRQVFGRNRDRVAAVAALSGTVGESDPSRLARADIYLIAVSDAAVAEVASSLPIDAAAVVAHTAGSVPVDALARFPRRAVFYPFQTFTKGREVDFSEIPILVETASPDLRGEVETFARCLSRTVLYADSALRGQVHLAGVFACNFANHLFELGGEVLRRAGVSADLLRPLIAETTARRRASGRRTDGPRRAGRPAHAGAPSPPAGGRRPPERHLPTYHTKHMGNFKEDIVKTEAFVFDVDGVFTDGGITPFGDDFIRRYYAKDGYAVSYASKLGYKICIITVGRGKWLQERFERLRVTKIYADCADKIAALREFLDEYGLDARNVVFMGDDIPDLECMRAVGIPVAPADAASEILEAARYVSEYPGGRGCVRDIVEQVLRARGQWALHGKGVNCSKEAKSE